MALQEKSNCHGTDDGVENNGPHCHDESFFREKRGLVEANLNNEKTNLATGDHAHAQKCGRLPGFCKQISYSASPLAS
jgi:hypothetical protein